MKEYDLYLPLHYNDGRPIEPDKLNRYKRRLVDAFGGLTHFPQENEGLWRFGGRLFRDKIVILRVLSDDPSRARQFFENWRSELQKDLGQADILIVERDVTMVE